MTEARYDQVARRYDAAMRPLERWFLADLRARVFAELAQDHHLLEIGGGTGLNFTYYARHMSGSLIEPSREMLNIARNKKPPNLYLVQGYAESLPFKDDSFDAAVATLVFCSVASPRDAFSEVKRVVKKGGKVVLLEHVRPANVLGPIFDLLSTVTSSLVDDRFNRRTADEAAAVGLRLVKVEKRFLGIINLIVCEVS